MSVKIHTAGVVGLGLMGTGITTCLLLSGYQVVGVEPYAEDLEAKREAIASQLKNAFEKGMTKDSPTVFLDRLHLTKKYESLKECRLVSENLIEDFSVKKEALQQIEKVLPPDAFLTTNTSSIPISNFQEHLRRPERFFGLHWMAPAYLTRFLEIICGKHSRLDLAQQLYQTAPQWSKEPILVKKDIRGFIGNRLMYAMYREACHLVEDGYASVEDVDRACRNNAGYWMTLFGVFQWMDMTGVKAYHSVMKELLPTLNNQKEIPELIDRIVKDGGNGVSNGKGFYSYSKEESQAWKEVFEEFSHKIRELALQYPSDVVERRLKEKT